MKRRILCFGDSNTWGYKPTGGRYDEETRWPMRMQRLLGDGYIVIEEGLNGRTCVFDDPVEGGYKSGAIHLPVSMMSHSPLDAVILMLGTNDTKCRFGMNAKTIGEGMMQLVRLARLYGYDAEGDPPRIVIAAPASILDCLMQAGHGPCFGVQAIGVSHDLTKEYARLAKLLRCEFFDAADSAEVSQLDAVHLTREGHLRLGEAMSRRIREMFENDIKTEGHRI